MGCKAFYSMEDPKGTLRVPSIIWKTSLFFPSILSLYASLFAFVKAKQCWFLYSKGLSLEPPSCFFIYLFLIIIIILAQMDKPIAERKPSKIIIFFLNLIILAQMDKIHWRKDTFQDFQHNIHSIHLIITYK